MPRLDSIKIKNNTTYQTLLDIIYPVGSVFFSWNNTNPASIFGGTWVKYGGGVIASEGSLGTTGASYVSKGSSGGSYYITKDIMPRHYHNSSSFGEDYVNFVSNKSFGYTRANAATTGNQIVATLDPTLSDLVVHNNEATMATGGGKAFTPYHHSFAVWKRTQ